MNYEQTRECVGQKSFMFINFLILLQDFRWLLVYLWHSVYLHELISHTVYKFAVCNACGKIITKLLADVFRGDVNLIASKIGDQASGWNYQSVADKSWAWFILTGWRRMRVFACEYVCRMHCVPTWDDWVGQCRPLPLPVTASSSYMLFSTWIKYNFICSEKFRTNINRN